MKLNISNIIRQYIDFSSKLTVKWLRKDISRDARVSVCENVARSYIQKEAWKVSCYNIDTYIENEMEEIKKIIQTARANDLPF